MIGRLLGRGRAGDKRGGVERQLARSVSEIARVSEELRVLDEQRLHLADSADDFRVRAMVSDNPEDGREHRHAGRALEKLEAERSGLQQRLADLRRGQDELLDQLGGS